MLNKIIAFSIKNKLIVGLFILALVGYGSYQFTQLPIDAVPDITDNQVQVITTAPSLGAPDIERLITFPIEQANSNIPGLKEIRSFSRFGLSLITIVFDDDVDIYWARQQVTERLKSAQEQIPKGLGLPELAPVTTGLGEIYQYVLRAKHGYETKYNATELRTIQDWTVRRQLLSVKGVADVSSFGGKLKQYEIAIDANKLKSFNININDVFTALEKNNENTGGAYIEKKSTVLYIRSEGLIGNIEDIKNIVVKNTANGTPLLINDVADVRIGNAIRYGALTYNDEGEAAGAVVMMLKGGNSNQVIKNVKERITQIEKTLPEGVEIEPFLDRTKMVNNAISTVAKNLMEGALIVILILVLFLGNFRAGFIVASVIPLAMLFAVIMMNLFGVSGNLMSLGALDFGLIVDGAVIIVEACLFQMHISKQKQVSQVQMDQIVYNTSTRMRNAAVFGEIIILVVYLPIFTLKGIEGKMFIPMAQTVAFALLGAFILSLTYIPMMSALFLSKTVSHKKNFSDKMMEVLENIHQKFLVKALAIPKLLIASTLILFALAIYIFTQMGGEFIPELPEGDFAVETRVLTGSNINTTTEACLKAAHILKNKFPEVEKVIGKIGSGEIPTDPMPMEAADLMIILKDKSEWKSAKTWDELSEKMSTALQDVPGVTYSFQFPVAMRFNELMTGAKQDVVCKIFGENLDTLSKYSKLLGEVANSINGAENIYVEPIDGLPQLIISYKRNAIAQYGLNIADINKVIRTAFAGQTSGLVFEDEKRFDLVVRLAGENRQELADVQNLLIPTPQGTQIPLYQVADVSIRESVNQIQRDDAKRRIIVGFNVKGRDVQSIVKDLQTKIEQQIKLPAGYYITYGGAFENLIAAKKRLGLAVPISLLLIFLLLYFAFNSVKQALLIYSAIPLSAIGGILFLAVRGMPFSISAGIGFIALFGVAVLNGIVLIAEYNRIKKEGETDLKQLVLQGTKHRLRPVLMTALVASLGFLPMALSTGAGSEVQRPLATVVIGGLLIATLLTLFVLPVLYILFEHFSLRKTTKKIPMAAVVVLLLFSFQQTKAQTTPRILSAHDAVSMALENNLQMQAEQLKVLAGTSLKKSVFELPKTNFNLQYGQYNSIRNDAGFQLNQSVPFPTYYSAKSKLYKAELQGSQLSQQATANEITAQVKAYFYQIIYLQKAKADLQHLDSLYIEFVRVAQLRFANGETNLLEKTTAETKQGELHLLVNQTESDLLSAIALLKQLLNSVDDFLIEIPSDFVPLTISAAIDTTLIESNPSLKLLYQQALIAEQNKKVETALSLPDFNIGYFNQSLIGNQTINGQNVFFDGNKRFQGINVGISIPLTFFSNAAKVKSFEQKKQALQKEADNGKLVLQTQLQNALVLYKQNLLQYNYFKTQALTNAETIISTATLGFRSGNIGYLEYANALQNATTIKLGHLQAVNHLNQSIININYLINN